MDTNRYHVCLQCLVHLHALGLVPERGAKPMALPYKACSMKKTHRQTTKDDNTATERDR